MITGYTNSLEHLMAELERVDLRVRLQIMRIRQRGNQPADDEFRGLYISEEEIDGLLADGSNSSDETDSSSLSQSPAGIALRRLEEGIARKKAESLANGIELRLCRLADAFGLGAFEVDALLICLLPEIDTKYEKLYAYLHDDVTRKKPSVNLVLQCLANTLDQRVTSRDAFLPQAPLVRDHLLRVEDESSGRPAPLLMRTLKIDDRVASYLLDSNQTDARLENCARIVEPGIGLDDMVLPAELKMVLSRLAQDLASGHNPVLYFQGSSGMGKRTATHALCQSAGLQLLEVNVNGLLTSELSAETAITLAIREAKLQGSALCWDRFDLLLSEERAPKALLNTAIQRVREAGGPVLLTGEATWHPGDTLAGRSFVRIELDFPSHTGRRQLWNMYLNGGGPTASEPVLDEVADKFRFTPSQVRDAAATARNLTLAHGESEISAILLYSACRVTSHQKLTLLARKIQPKYMWDDIVLPQDQTTQLREIANYVKFRHLVFADWHFERKISLGKGLNTLFAGPSGTGKTMAAEIIAHELGLDLYKIDLSTVVSKYIGETEKNLDRIFTEARNSNSILFFDEADAVFGKRSEVRDSHDRYANIEVAYLLQKMEEYDGIVILATNLRKNIDEAFARRMHFAIEFPHPEETDRLRIWESVFPPEAPVSPELDLRFMARQFKLTGGNIKNIALGAAFLAASDSGRIDMEHLIRATKREFQKIGRLCTQTDFAKYFGLVNG